MVWRLCSLPRLLHAAWGTLVIQQRNKQQHIGKKRNKGLVVLSLYLQSKTGLFQKGMVLAWLAHPGNNCKNSDILTGFPPVSSVDRPQPGVHFNWANPPPSSTLNLSEREWHWQLPQVSLFSGSSIQPALQTPTARPLKKQGGPRSAAMSVGLSLCFPLFFGAVLLGWNKIKWKHPCGALSPAQSSAWGPREKRRESKRGISATVMAAGASWGTGPPGQAAPRSVLPQKCVKHLKTT